MLIDKHTAVSARSDGMTFCDADLMRQFRERSQSCGLYLDADKEPDGYKGHWQAICAWEQIKSQAGHPIYPQELRAKIHEIAGRVPDPMAAFAVNTTRLGRPLDETTGTGGLNQ
jgi:hypothetical protein